MNTWNWWDDLMQSHRQKARNDARRGVYEPPNTGETFDPQEQAENEVYQFEWAQVRSEKMMLPL